MTLMVNKTEKTINLVGALIGISREKGAYTLFYWCTHLRFKTDFLKNNQR